MSKYYKKEEIARLPMWLNPRRREKRAPTGRQT